MSDRSRVGLFGRLITIFAIAWILLPLLAALTGLRPGLGLADLPILPGIILLFVGRAMVRRSRRGSIEDLPGSGQAEPGEQATGAPQSTPVRTPSPPQPVTPRVREIRSAPEPEAEAMAEALGNMDEEIAEALQQAGSRKTSAEMVTEARERFGRRP